MTCKLCNIEPVYKLPNDIKLCKTCFIKYFEEKVFRTIKNYNLISYNDKIAIATSGGKDSITVLYLVKKYLTRKNKNYDLKNITAIAIDEGIKDYRENTLNFLKTFCKKEEIELKIITFKELFSHTLDQAVEKTCKNSNISACNICGTLRRFALNTASRNIKADKLVTGHNLDDEAQSIMLNVFKNNMKILSRLGPYNGVLKNEKFIPRVKPLYLVTEKEVRIYTILKGFNVSFNECPYSQTSFRGDIAQILNKLENDHCGIKTSVVNFYLDNMNSFRNSFIEKFGQNVTYCTICGEPSQNKICNACKMIKTIEKKDIK